MGLVVTIQQKQEPDRYTEACGIFPPSLNDPQLQPTAERPQPGAQYRCPRCGSTYPNPSAVRVHFPHCIKVNGNSKSLKCFNHEDNGVNGIAKENLQAKVNAPKRKRSGYGGASVLMAQSKVDKWATMAAEKQAAYTASPSDNSKDAQRVTIHNSTAVTEPAPHVSSQVAMPVVDKPALTPSITPKRRKIFATPSSRNESPTQAQKQKKPRQQKPRKSRQPAHDVYTAHLFNNAGMLIPSIPGVDAVTERLFDQGKIMSLGQSRPNDNYYPGGEPRGRSFLLELA